MKIGFYGAAEMVTGSKHLITLQNGKKLLLDCGMFQGRGAETDKMNRHFGFAPHEVDYLVLSHAHIDHSGLIPLLVKEGFNGRIFCTPGTLDLCNIMLADSAGIQESETEYINEKRRREGRKPLEPLYTTADVFDALRLFEKVSYNVPFTIDENFELLYTDAGHIIGSACVNLSITENDQKSHLTFTGDIGRYNGRILRDPQDFPQADYIICESTYANREHESQEDVENKLLRIVEETCVIKKGKLIIPAFSVGRTQEIVNVLNNLEHEGKLPRIKVYVDSPLSTSATDIMRRHKAEFNEKIREYMDQDPTPFGFVDLNYIRDVKESIALNDSKEPCIIISASGMMEAGRIKHHTRNNIENPNNTILIIGWCTPSSLGGRLRNGEKQVSIFGKQYDVNADVEIIDAFSAHGDYHEMLQFLSCQDPKQVKKIFLVHGDEETLPIWKTRLQEAGFEDITIPHWKETYIL